MSLSKSTRLCENPSLFGQQACILCRRRGFNHPSAYLAALALAHLWFGGPESGGRPCKKEFGVEERAHQVVVCAKVEGEEDFCLVCGQGACNARDGARTRCNHEAGGSRAGCTQDCGLKRGVVHEPVGNIYANLSRLWCVIGGGCDVHESAASWTAKQRHPLNYC